MKRNVGNAEKIVRVVVGLIAGYLGFAISPWFYVIALIAFATAAIGYCPATHLLGINTYTPKESGDAGKTN